MQRRGGDLGSREDRPSPESATEVFLDNPEVIRRVRHLNARQRLLATVSPHLEAFHRQLCTGFAYAWEMPFDECDFSRVNHNLNAFRCDAKRAENWA